VSGAPAAALSSSAGLAWAVLATVASTAFIGACYAGIYLASGRSLLPVMTGHIVTDMLIEPWLTLASLSGALGRTSGS
jgi:hypothetical protein